MSTGNICNYTPLQSISGKEIDRRFQVLHRALCYLTSSASSAIASADEGLSVTGTSVRLGQAVTDTSDAALMTDTRVIPMPYINDGVSINLVDSDFPGQSLMSLGPSLIVLTFDSAVLDDTALINVSEDTTTESFQIQFHSNLGTPYYELAGSIRLQMSQNVGIKRVPTAYFHIAAGTATAGSSPLKLTSGTNLTTPETGSIEYNGTNLFFTRTGTTRENILTGNSGATAPTTTAAGTVTNRYGGATNFLGDPNSWASVVIGGTTYKIPLYT